MAHVRKPVKRGANPLSPEAFTLRAIERLKGKYPGMHTVYSGFNRAFRAVYPTLDPVAFTQALARKGKIRIRPVKGGAMLFLPGGPQDRSSLSFEVMRALHDGQRRNPAIESDHATSWNVEREQAFLARLLPIFALAQKRRVTPEEIVRRSNAAGIDLLTPFADVPRETLVRISRLFKRKRRKIRKRPAPRRPTHRKPQRTKPHTGRGGELTDARTVAVYPPDKALATASANTQPDNSSGRIAAESPTTTDLQQPGSSCVLHADTGRAPEAEAIAENRSSAMENAQVFCDACSQKDREITRLHDEVIRLRDENIRLCDDLAAYGKLEGEWNQRIEPIESVADLGARDQELAARKEDNRNLEPIAEEQRVVAMTSTRPKEEERSSGEEG